MVLCYRTLKNSEHQNSPW